MRRSFILFTAMLTITWASSDLLSSSVTVKNTLSSGARPADGAAIPAERLGNSDYCGHCHTDIFHQWNASSHHFSSFNNPVYRRVALETAERRGADVLKFCANCHDPLPLMAGTATSTNLDKWGPNAGITCLACHRITAIHGGNGQYEISAPTLHPFALSDHPLLQKAHRLLLQVTPGLHRSVLNKPFYRSPEFCATCHTVSSPATINVATDLLMQDELGQWRATHYAAPAEGGTSKDCIDCHMPLVTSNDPAAKNGLIRSHRFTGGNTLSPTLNLDFDQLRATTHFLSDGIVQLECMATESDSATRAVKCSDFTATAHENVTIRIDVTNRGVGHNFPAGTSDSNEAWLEVQVHDAQGKLLLTSGVQDQRGHVDASAHFLRAQYVDHDDVMVDRRNATTDAVRKVSDTTIPAGATRGASFDMELPKSTAWPLQIHARLNWRKHSPAFLDWVFSGREIPPAPVTPLAEIQTTLGKPPR